MHELVTGEAVVLDLRPAGFASRGLAFALDLAVQIVLVIAAIYIAAQGLVQLDAAAGQAAFGVLLLVLFVGLPVGVETLTHGRSLGKLAAGLRVVRLDGGPVRLRQSLVRALLALGEIYLALGSPALICALATRRGQRIGDLSAGTYVVRERTARSGGRRAAMPPELATWAHDADIGRLPDELALAARQYVARLDTMQPGPAMALADRIASQLTTHVFPAPPRGTSADAFCQAVLAERRRRDALRLDRDRERRERAERSAAVQHEQWADR